MYFSFQAVLSVMKQRNVSVNVQTFGCLALGCQQQKDGLQLLEDMEVIIKKKNNTHCFEQKRDPVATAVVSESSWLTWFKTYLYLVINFFPDVIRQSQFLLTGGKVVLQLGVIRAKQKHQPMVKRQQTDSKLTFNPF